MSPQQQFADYLATCPIIAILRGIEPAEVVSVGRALVEAGVRIIEIPLNSPEPFESIERLADDAGQSALIGAGTVLNVADVERVRRAGGQLVVSPNTNPEIIAATVAGQMVSVPGYFTPTEAFAAINAGAHAIKLFPAEAATPAIVKAQRAVLPTNIPLLVVGGVQPTDVGDWLSAGANGFGLGGAIYRPGRSAQQVHDQAIAFIDALVTGATA
ncbi:MAG: 2-dehydro-3-deoxy-6-phosphogalactonate aldolase [Sphingomonadaceae bacterium]|nr:2-dehydro-3-deoxy-6-phosphogalactonate aldolase [Sphingomonadaceae bacterium]